VAAIAERNGRFLFVEERNGAGSLVINQPAGHLEGSETLIDAVVRECLEETGCRFRPESVVGLYLWSHPEAESGFLRVCFAGSAGEPDPSRELDEGIERVLWLNRAELAGEAGRLRSPLVLHGIDDYLAGERYSLSLLKSLISD
jgi:8-oxo-dGTP pyrophosphatase MutT (NUDIX family)